MDYSTTNIKGEPNLLQQTSSPFVYAPRKWTLAHSVFQYLNQFYFSPFGDLGQSDLWKTEPLTSPLKYRRPKWLVLMARLTRANHLMMKQ